MSTTTTNDGPMAPGGSQDKAPAPGLRTSFLLMAGYWLLLVLASAAVRGFGLDAAFGESWLLKGGAAVALAILATLAWECRAWLMRVLTSVPFSVAQLVWLMIMTAVGTVIVQLSPPEIYAQRYGDGLGWLLLTLGMDDLFHAPWFTGLLALTGCSLVLTAVRKRAWRPALWGHLLSHMGFVVVLLGGWIGSTFGYQGIIDMHEGEVANEFTLLSRSGMRGENRPLGFSLQLENFAIEHYEAEPKFYVYQREGDQFRAVDVVTLEELASDHKIGASGASFRLAAVYPEFILRPVIQAVPPGSGQPVLQIDFRQEDWSARAALQADVPGKDATPLSARGPQLRFRWAEPSAAELAQLTAGSSASHQIVLQSAHGEEIDTATVRLGAPVTMPQSGFTIEALQYLPDFTYDTKAKQARTRSQEPNNPALRIRITDPSTQASQERWLYAKMPNFGHDGENHQQRFVYRYQPAQGQAPVLMLVIGETREILRLERGQVAKRLPLEQWPEVCDGLPVAGMQVHESAVVEMVPDTMSEAWKNPVADIVIEEGGSSRTVRVSIGHEQPLAFADNTIFLSFDMRSNEPKAFRSHLTVLEGGQPITDKTIVVNDPLSYKGFMFYQSNFRKDDPTYSGIKVVYDPGLIVAIIGMVMIFIGVPFVYYVRPRLLRNESND